MIPRKDQLIMLYCMKTKVETYHYYYLMQLSGNNTPDDKNHFHWIIYAFNQRGYPINGPICTKLQDQTDSSGY